MMTIATFRTAAILCLSLGLLAGCGTAPIESAVQSYTGLPGTTAKAGTFRFERLPSQQQDPIQASKLEAFAQPALEQAGFRRDDARAQYSVQLGAYSLQQVPVPYAVGLGPRYFVSGFDRWMFYNSYWAGPGRWGPDPIYVSGVSVIIRDLASGKVVYETNATNEQRWFDPDKVFSPMFIAAMKDFPNAPSGSRNISVATVPAR